MTPLGKTAAEPPVDGLVVFGGTASMALAKEVLQAGRAHTVRQGLAPPRSLGLMAKKVHGSAFQVLDQGRGHAVGHPARGQHLSWR